MMTVAAMLPPYLLWTPDEPHGYDAVEYHLQGPLREVVREAGRIVPLHHNVFSYLPFNVEMHYLLADAPTRRSLGGHAYRAVFVHAAFIALSILAAGERSPGDWAKSRIAPVVADIDDRRHPAMLTRNWVQRDRLRGSGFLFFGVLSIGWTLIALHVNLKIACGDSPSPGCRMAGFGKVRGREAHRPPRNSRGGSRYHFRHVHRAKRLAVDPHRPASADARGLRPGGAAHLRPLADGGFAELIAEINSIVAIIIEQQKQYPFIWYIDKAAYPVCGPAEPVRALTCLTCKTAILSENRGRVPKWDSRGRDCKIRYSSVRIRPRPLRNMLRLQRDPTGV